MYNLKIRKKFKLRQIDFPLHLPARGLYTTSIQGTLIFKLPEFSNSKDITWSMDMGNGKLEELGYDMPWVQ